MIRRGAVFCFVFCGIGVKRKGKEVKQTYDELACDTEIRSRSNCSRRRLLCSSWRWRRTSVDMAGICVVVVGVGVGGVVAVVAAA